MEARVSLAEIGISVAELNGLRAKVGPDWRGDPSLSLDDAAELVQKRQEATAAHEARWRAHQSANEAWLAGRVAAGREAARRATVGLRPSAAVYGKAREAWLEGALEFQARNRRPEWEGVPTIHPGLLLSPEDLTPGMNSESAHEWEVF